MELINNPYFVLLAFILVIGLGYVLTHQESIPGFLFLFMAGMGSFLQAASIGKVSLLKAILLPTLFVILLFGRLAKKQPLPFGNLALLMLFMVLTVVSSWINGISFDLVRPYIGTLLVALVVAICPDKDKTVRYLVVAIAFWGLVNLLAAVLIGRGWVQQGDMIHTGSRVEGLMGTSNEMGVYFVIALNAIHVLFYQVKAKALRLLLLGAGVGMAIGLLGTLSRSSFTAWVVSSLFIQYRLRGIRIGSLLAISGAALLVATVASLLHLDTMIAGRFAVIEHDSSALYRITLFEEAMRFFEQKMWFGVGISQGGLGAKDVLVNSHNTYLQKLMENGIVGFALFALLLWKAMRGLWKRAGVEDKNSARPYYVVLLAMLGAILVNGVFHDLSYIMPLWLLVGIGLMI